MSTDYNIMEHPSKGDLWVTEMSGKARLHVADGQGGDGITMPDLDAMDLVTIGLELLKIATYLDPEVTKQGAGYLRGKTDIDYYRQVLKELGE
jgi:hypothetical protein